MRPIEFCPTHENSVTSPAAWKPPSSSGRFLLGQSRPVCVGLLQVAFYVLEPKVPSLLVVLQNQSIVQDLEIFDLDGRQFVNGRSIPTETAKLRFVFCGRFLEQLFVLS